MIDEKLYIIYLERERERERKGIAVRKLNTLTVMRLYDEFVAICHIYEVV